MTQSMTRRTRRARPFVVAASVMALAAAGSSALLGPGWARRPATARHR